jgi:hypothetical protein
MPPTGADAVGPGLARPGRRQHRFEDVGLDHLVGGEEAVLLVLEVLVEGAAGDPGRGGDRGDRGRVPAVLAMVASRAADGDPRRLRELEPELTELLLTSL